MQATLASAPDRFVSPLATIAGETGSGSKVANFREEVTVDQDIREKIR